MIFCLSSSADNLFPGQMNLYDEIFQPSVDVLKCGGGMMGMPELKDEPSPVSSSNKPALSPVSDTSSGIIVDVDSMGSLEADTSRNAGIMADTNSQDSLDVSQFTIRYSTNRSIVEYTDFLGVRSV